uniref:NADH-ubiquinone oxidoreductase chain 3 n=1 Tax=Taeniothrips tigris TaxID=2824824 RepID=A0A8A9WM43_9NEOP|nr:NADH dehydrogenase subunit 3 [Taeniothrips tigris]QTT60740.1 NADH dehydrogenase subunit 3 [Taeniothrips tigris]
MLMITLTAFSTFLISMILLMLTISLSKKSSNKKEKSTPFECGFNFFNHSRLSFSMQFFLIAIIFIIFDVEIVMMLPLISTIKCMNLINWSITSISFITILMVGIIMEWKEKSFDWK